jgi:hypothetical protein
MMAAAMPPVRMTMAMEAGSSRRRVSAALAKDVNGENRMPMSAPA